MRRSLLMLMLLTIAATAHTAPPRTLNYQGVLTDNAGTPVPDGTYDMTFRIYNVASGGTPLWLETQNVTVTNGRFDVILGSVVSLGVLGFDEPYWLGLEVDPDPEMTPRTELAGAPYSQISRTVEDNAVTTGKIASGTVIRSLNGLTDYVNITGGTNVTVNPTGSSIEISASGGGGGNAPGLASAKNIGSGSLTGPGTIDNLVSRTINCPAAGYVLAIASCDVFVSHVNGNPTYAIVGTSDNSSSIPSNQQTTAQIPFSAPSGIYTIPLTSHGVYSVSAGNNTFYMLGEKGGNGSASVSAERLTLIYFEATYGSVSPTLVNDPEVSAGPKPGRDIGIEGSGPITGEDDIAREVADLRARLAALEARLGNE